MKVDRKVLARSSPAGLAWWASGGKDGEPSWIPAPHLMLLSEAIVRVATGQCPRLIVTMPPRHGKSELISKYAPAWFLGRFPDRKVMLTSYADSFASQWGRRARDVLEVEGPDLFGVRVDPETAGGQLWEVKGRDGIMVTAGVGGGLTGKGAHLLIIDDPVKNAVEAQSQTTRDAHHAWWKSTARTRLQKGAGVILVMTRWHEDDLAGRLLKDMKDGEGDDWEVLNLPAFAEEDDALGREVDDVLWPEMFDEEWMDQTRRAMGTYWFTAMYQQRPSPAEGMLFKRNDFRYYEKTDAFNDVGDPIVKLVRGDGEPVEILDPAYCRKFCTADIAGSSKEESDYTVIATWLVTPKNDLLLWDIERVQYESLDVPGAMRRVYQLHQPAFMGVERLGFGLTVIQELVREGLPIIRLEPDKDKVSRALPAVARMEQHTVFFPHRAPWREDFEHELLAFPNGTNDDQVDVLAYAALQLPRMGHGMVRGSNTPRGGRAAVARTKGVVVRGRGKTIAGGIMDEKF